MSLQDSLDLELVIILITFFCNIKTLLAQAYDSSLGEGHVMLQDPRSTSRRSTASVPAYAGCRSVSTWSFSTDVILRDAETSPHWERVRFIYQSMVRWSVFYARGWAQRKQQTFLGTVLFSRHLQTWLSSPLQLRHLGGIAGNIIVPPSCYCWTISWFLLCGTSCVSARTKGGEDQQWLNASCPER
jgi:hypothetical protein